LQGKTAYWSVLVRRYQDSLLEGVPRLVENPGDAVEVVELTFLRASTDLASFKEFQRALHNKLLFRPKRGQQMFLLWLCRLALHAFLGKARKP
jgi:DNA-directed RNA polymerase specialized sigma24 family protein